jgi:hypothetical protein
MTFHQTPGVFRKVHLDQALDGRVVGGLAAGQDKTERASLTV